MLFYEEDFPSLFCLFGAYSLFLSLLLWMFMPCSQYERTYGITDKIMKCVQCFCRLRTTQLGINTGVCVVPSCPNYGLLQIIYEDDKTRTKKSKKTRGKTVKSWRGLGFARDERFTANAPNKRSKGSCVPLVGKNDLCFHSRQKTFDRLSKHLHKGTFNLSELLPLG